ncbi:uncharacterized protein At1g08160-like [Ziziphus jujuba]|nr:uncharacterized protein At1g08160-like [Ziziphus jujuba]
MGTIWAVVKPKRPVYAIEYAHIEKAVPNSELTSLAGNFSFVMRAYNPNKKSNIYYESMKIYNTIDSGNENAIPVRLVEDFFQRPFNVTQIHFLVLATFSSNDGADIINEYLLHGRITAKISVKAVMKFRHGS